MGVTVANYNRKIGANPGVVAHRQLDSLALLILGPFRLVDQWRGAHGTTLCEESGTPAGQPTQLCIDPEAGPCNAEGGPKGRQPVRADFQTQGPQVLDRTADRAREGVRQGFRQVGLGAQTTAAPVGQDTQGIREP